MTGTLVESMADWMVHPSVASMVDYSVEKKAWKSVDSKSDLMVHQSVATMVDH